MSSAAPHATTARATPTDPARRRGLYLAVGGAAALAGVGLGWVMQPQHAPSEPPPALWGLSFQSPDAAPIAMQAFLGKPLLLNFWATWCPPCVEELPLLDRFYTENKAKGWQVLAIAVDQSSAVKPFLQRMPLQFPIAMAGMGGVDLSKTLGNLSGALPFTVVLGSEGRVLHRKMGRVTPDDLRSWSGLR